jgi:hypothetical protein
MGQKPLDSNGKDCRVDDLLRFDLHGLGVTVILLAGLGATILAGLGAIILAGLGATILDEPSVNILDEPGANILDELGATALDELGATILAGLGATLVAGLDATFLEELGFSEELGTTFTGVLSENLIVFLGLAVVLDGPLSFFGVLG